MRPELKIVLILASVGVLSSPAQGQTSACRPADAVSAGLVADLQRIASGTDSTNAGLRSLLQIPQVATSQVTYVTNKTTCNKALTPYNTATHATDANTGAEVDPPSGQLYVVQVGTVYAVWDPVKMVGEYRSYVTLDSKFKVLANTLF
ncbi:MAG TPA: hypothetical protein VK132_10410 [Gemmatimonadales bacterium]|nr:hypothetical protein [Gemmatimonadales bacterium]